MRIIFIFAFALLSQLSFSQEIIYFDANWQECSKSKAAYYRLIENLDNGLYFVKDYYITGELQFEGTSTVNTEPLSIEGEAIWYYENGKVETSRFYKDGLLNGKYFDYYEDGQLFEEGFYKNDKRDGLFVTYDSDESIFTYLYYKENILDGLYVEVIEGDTICRAFFKNNELNGPYYRYYYQRNTSIHCNFLNNNLDGPYSLVEPNEASLNANFVNGNLDKTFLIMDLTVNDTNTYALFENNKALKYKSYIREDDNVCVRELTSEGEVEVWNTYLNGKRVIKSAYIKGYPTGEWDIYNITGQQLLERVHFNPFTCGFKEVEDDFPVFETSIYEKLKYPFMLLPSFPERYYSLVVPIDYECAEGAYERYNENGELLLSCYIKDLECTGKTYKRDEGVDDFEKPSYFKYIPIMYKDVRFMGDIKFIEDDDIYKDDEFGFIGEGTIVEPDVPYEVSLVYQYENDILNNKDFQESKKFEEKNNLQYFYDKWKGIDIVLICSFSNYSFLKEINSDNVVTDNQLFIYMIRPDKEYNDVFYSNKLVYKFGEYTKQTIARNWQEFEEFVENDFLKGDIYYAPEIINSIELELEE